MTTLATEPDRDDQEMSQVLGELVPRSLNAAALNPTTRTQLMDLLEVQRGPINPSSYAWADVGPGLKIHVVSEDAARGVKRCLVWGVPGASTPRHGHSGDEVILVLQGNLEDDRGSYGPGGICRSRAGDVHQEQVVGEADCVCFVVYYGDLIVSS